MKTIQDFSCIYGKLGNKVPKQQSQFKEGIRDVMQTALGPANKTAISMVLHEELSLISIRSPEAPSSKSVE